MALKKATTLCTPSTTFGPAVMAVRNDAGANLAGSTNKNFAPLSLDPYGALRTNPEFQGVTFDSVITGLVPASAATDILTISGSATAIIAVHRIVITGSATVQINTPVTVVRRAAADTSGTSATLTSQPRDPGNDTVAATAVIKKFTANPTLGSGTTTVGAADIFCNTATGANVGATFTFDPPIILGTASTTLAVNLGAASILGGTLAIQVTHSERPTTS